MQSLTFLVTDLIQDNFRNFISNFQSLILSISQSLYFSPAKPYQINPPLAIKPHAFRFQQCALRVKTQRRPRADLALRVHDAMPGHIVGAIVHRPAHRSRTPRHPQRPRNLPISGDASARDFARERVDAGERIIGRGLTRKNADYIAGN
jgi:hypothetical protein